MIGAVNTRLRDWVRGVVGPVEVCFRAPGPTSPLGVGLYLLDLLPSLPANERGRPGRPALLRYLVTSTAPSLREAEIMLDKLRLAARLHDEFDAGSAPVPDEAWAAAGVQPLPSFMLHVPAPRVRDHPEASAPDDEPVWVIEGRVVGPGGRSLPEALVAAAPLRLATQTDDRGRFRFPNVPASVSRVQMSVQAGGRVTELSVDLPAPSLVIQVE